MELVPIFESDDPLAIQQAKAVLDSSGIPCLFPGEHFASMFPAHAFAMGPLKLLIRPQDLDEASDLLGPIRDVYGKPEKKAETAGPELYCPRCGSLRVKDATPLVPRLLHAVAGLLVLGSVSMPPLSRRCLNCGHRW